MHDLRPTEVTRRGSTLLLNGGRDGEIPCGTETAALAFLRVLEGTPRAAGEPIYRWVWRAAVSP